MYFDVLLETAFIIQHDCSQAQPCVFCKCYLYALSVLIHPTEFIKHSLWARCHVDAGDGLSNWLMKKHSVMVSAVIERCTGIEGSTEGVVPSQG